MDKNRVLITGYGVVSPYGIGADKMFQGLRDNRSCVVNVNDIPGSANTSL